MRRAHPLSKKEGWRSSRRRWRDEARTALREFPEISDSKIIYDYGLVRVVRMMLKTDSRPRKAKLMSRVLKWFISRGYDPIESGALECERFRASIAATTTRLVLCVECRRDDEVDIIPVCCRITQSEYIEDCTRRLKGTTYVDSMGREVEWAGRDGELRQIRYYHQSVVRRAIRAGMKVPKRVLRGYLDLEKA